MASRTMKLTYKGITIQVREGFDNQCELLFSTGNRVKSEAKTFTAATNEARKWLLDNAGQMRGDYTRGKT